jgi:UDP-glucose 4-epimerase
VHLDFDEIRILSRDEKKQDDMRKRYKNEKIRFFLGDTRDRESIAGAVKGSNYIFHAAALKQVPSCEFFPIEAVKTNILGSENVMDLGVQFGVERIICLSTDKAVQPVNAMGMSKALMEKIAQSVARNHPQSQTKIAITRYGNVMMSRGSVIPLFIDQIKSKGPITLTNPAMTRFMMSLDNSVELVMYAFEHGKPGDIFVQKSPGATIQHLAEALKELFNSNNEIHIIGERHSEKLYETLCSKEEMSKAVDLGKFYRIPADFRDLNYTKYIQEDGPKLINEEYNSHNTIRLSKNELKELLLTLDFVKEELKNFNL